MSFFRTTNPTVPSSYVAFLAERPTFSERADQRAQVALIVGPADVALMSDEMVADLFAILY